MRSEVNEIVRTNFGEVSPEIERIPINHSFAYSSDKEVNDAIAFINNEEKRDLINMFEEKMSSGQELTKEEIASLNEYLDEYHKAKAVLNPDNVLEGIDKIQLSEDGKIPANVEIDEQVVSATIVPTLPVHIEEYDNARESEKEQVVEGQGPVQHPEEEHEEASVDTTPHNPVSGKEDAIDANEAGDAEVGIGADLDKEGEVETPTATPQNVFDIDSV